MNISNDSYIYSYIYSYISDRKSNGDLEYFNSYKKHFNGGKILLKSMVDYLLTFNLSKLQKYEIIFIGNRFNDMYQYLDNSYDCLFLQLSMRESLECFKNGKYYKNMDIELLKLVDNYNKKDIIKKEKALNNVIDKINKLLVSTSPKLIILWNDSLFLERVFVYCSKKLGIKTITIQHGLFQFSNPRINDGYFSDYFLTWGNYTKNKYIEYGIKDENHIFVLGYPYKSVSEIKHIEKNIFVKKKKLCFLGQEFRKDKENLKLREFCLINDIKLICDELDIEFIYRPHPGEEIRDLKRIIGDKITNKQENLMDTINSNDIFMSINSTALIEAALYGKICTEIVFEGVLSYNYEEAGACYTINNNISELRKFLLKCINNDIKPFKVSSNYLYLSDNIGERFMKIIEQILQN